MDTRTDMLRSLGTLAPDAERRLGAGAVPGLADHWQRLCDRGFELHVRRDALLARHPARGFEASVQFSRPDDLGERRQLFRALRSSFGGRLERWFPGWFQASPAVAQAYESLNALVAACERLRNGDGSVGQAGP